MPLQQRLLCRCWAAVYIMYCAYPETNNKRRSINFDWTPSKFPMSFTYTLCMRDFVLFRSNNQYANTFFAHFIQALTQPPILINNIETNFQPLQSVLCNVDYNDLAFETIPGDAELQQEITNETASHWKNY